MVVCGFAAAGSSAFAEMTVRAVVNVPFEFVLEGTRMPADEYRIVEDANTGLMMVRGTKLGRSIALLSVPGQKVEPGAATLRFEKISGEAHLSAFGIEGQPERLVRVKPVRESSGNIAVAGH